MPMETTLLHVTSLPAWQHAKTAGTLSAAPFLHLCTEAQLAFVLRQHFAGRTGLVVLRADTQGLDLRWETSEPGMDPFPHLYEALPVAAVISATPI